MLKSWTRDARYALRRLRAHAGYALLATFTLALGVGGTASIYGVAKGVLFEPLPYANERDVGVFWKKTDWTEVAVLETTSMQRVLDNAIGPARQVMLLLSLLSALALTLGAIGIYGVIAHFAARRRRDWAIRVALGLRGSRVVAHVVRHGALLVASGIGIGVLAAAALARVLSSFLYGVDPVDPTTFAVAAAALLSVGLLAALLPAWRAGMTDPAIVLRDE